MTTNGKSRMILRSHRVAGLCCTFEIDDQAVFRSNACLLGLVICLGMLVLALPGITGGQRMVTAAVIFSSAAIIASRLRPAMRKIAEPSDTPRHLVAWSDAVAVLLLLFWGGIAWLLVVATRSVLH